MNYLLVFNLICLTVSLNVCVYAFARPQRECGSQRENASGKAYMLLLALAVLVAVGIRLYRFGLVPGGFNQDGAMAAMDAKALAQYGTDRLGMRFPVHLTAWGYGQMSAMLSYLMAAFIELLGFTRVALRLPQLLVSLMGLAFLYLFVKDSFGRRAALCVLLFAAIDPWHIMQSRWALDCNLFSHFLMGGLFFLNRGVKSLPALLASMLLFGLSMYCYGIALYTVPLFLLLAAAWLLYTHKLGLGRVLIALCMYLLIAWPFFAVMLINYLGLDTIATPLFTIPFFPDTLRVKDMLFFSEQPLAQLGENFLALIRTVFLQTRDLPWNAIEGFGTMYLFSLPLTLVGLYRALRRRGDTGAVLTLLLFAVGIFAGLVTNSVNINRINIIFYPMLIFTGLGICACVRPLPAKCAVAAMYSAAFILFACSYFTSYAGEIRYQFLDDFGQALLSVKTSDAQRIYITSNSQYSGSTMASEILAQFYLELDAKYCEGETAEGETPYRQKYRVADISRLQIDPEESAVYIVRYSELPRFEELSCEVTQFERFYTVEVG